MTEPRIFLTDYASYNNGTQFEFGHWLDLDQFGDAEDLQEYITNHFEEADQKSPLFGGAREETMITDFEGFPDHFYGECMNFEPLFEFLNLDEDEKLLREINLELGRSEDEETQFFEGSTYSCNDVWEAYEQIFGDIEEKPYFSFDWEHYAKECLTMVNVDGTNYITFDY
jgi:hypothetical protein